MPKAVGSGKRKKKVSIAAVTKRTGFSQRGEVDLIILKVFVECSFSCILGKWTNP